MFSLGLSIYVCIHVLESILRWTLTKLTALMHFGTGMNATRFGTKGQSLKLLYSVFLWNNMLKTEVCGWRHTVLDVLHRIL